MADKDLFFNKPKAKQLVSFNGMRFDNGIYPTDIDMLLEYKKSSYVFCELKYKDCPVPTGQHKALVRVVDDLTTCRPTLLIYASHEDKHTDKDVDASKAIVKQYRFGGKWYIAKKAVTVRMMVERFVNKFKGAPRETTT